MSDRACVRGCTLQGVHYAACKRSRSDYTGPFPCPGCAPRECRDGSLICDKCFGRMRALLGDAPDLLARLRSIGDPTKATAYDDVKVGSSSGEIPAPIAADLIDAMRVVRVATWWHHEDLTAASNNLDTILFLGELLLDRHPEVNGLRERWSVQDAVDRWGVERRDRTTRQPEPDDDRIEITTPVSEWGDPLVGGADAERLAGTLRTLQRWIKAGDITPVGTTYIAGRRTRIFRRAELLALRDRGRDRSTSNLTQNRPEGDAA